MFLLHQGGMGDFILSLPAIAALVQHHDIPADIWTQARHIPLLRCLHRPLSGKSADYPRLAALYTDKCEPDFLRQKYDLAYVFGRKRNDTFMGNLSAAAGGTASFIPTFPADGFKVHVIDHQKIILERSGITGVSRYPEIQVNEKDLVNADKWLQGYGFTTSPLACHLGSGSTRKNWPAPNFAGLRQWFECSQGIPVLMIAGPAEEEIAEPSFRAPVARNLPLNFLAAILARCRGYGGNDSGITHLAAAVGTPTLALFGPTEPEVWAPRGPRVLVLKAGNEMDVLKPEYVTEQAEAFFI
jgi:ADP-heptose:LPS heptosyltransferase